MNYLENSYGFDSGQSFLGGNYFVMIFSSFVFLHSIVINWNNNKKRDFVRTSSELAAVCGILAGLCSILTYHFNNPVTVAIVYDFLGTGVFELGIQLCDNYMVLNRCLLIVKKKNEKWTRVLMHLFIFLFLVLPWAPFFWFVPFFMDCNSDRAWHINSVTYGFQTGAQVLYDAYFTAVFLRILHRSTNIAACSSSGHLILALKSSIHCLISLFTAIFIYFRDSADGQVLYEVLTIFGLHFVFNYKIEKTSLFRKLARKMGPGVSLSSPKKSQKYLLRTKNRFPRKGTRINVEGSPK